MSVHGAKHRAYAAGRRQCGEEVTDRRRIEFLQRLARAAGLGHEDRDGTASGTPGSTLAKGGAELIYAYDGEGEETAIVDLLQELSAVGIGFSDLHTTQRSLEDIFVGLLRANA